MKKLILLTAFACCSAVLTAQNPKGKFSIKPMAGINLTRLSGGTGDLYHNKVRFTAGVEAEYGVNEWLGISLGSIYSQEGARVEGGIRTGYVDNGTTYVTSTGLDGKLHSEYINIPLLANIYIPWVKGLSVRTGVQMGLLVGSKVEADYQTVSISYIEPESQNGLTVYNDPVFSFLNISMSDICKSVDFGIPFGLSYEYKNVVLDARYYFGLTKIDNTPNPEDCRNRYFSFTLGYRFHL